MSSLSTRLGTAGLFAGLLAAPFAPAQAETHATCTGFIDTVPTTITTQGNWCLRKDLSTGIGSGAAITIETNNVTIDCNGYKVGGLEAGPGSTANGIVAVGRLNATVRNCTVRGFRNGLLLGGGGHLVEDNRIEQNLYTGIHATGDGNVVRRNRILDTGGAPGSTTSNGFYGSGDLIDNTIAGVYADAPGGKGIGIYNNGIGNEISGNRIRGLEGAATGINAAGTRMTVRGNTVSLEVEVPLSKGIMGGTPLACIDNTVTGFADAYSACTLFSGNLAL